MDKTETIASGRQKMDTKKLVCDFESRFEWFNKRWHYSAFKIISKRILQASATVDKRLLLLLNYLGRKWNKEQMPLPLISLSLLFHLQGAAFLRDYFLITVRLELQFVWN